MPIYFLLAYLLGPAAMTADEYPDSYKRSDEIEKGVATFPNMLLEAVDELSKRFDCLAKEKSYTYSQKFGHIIRFSCKMSLEESIIVIWSSNEDTYNFATYPSLHSI